MRTFPYLFFMAISAFAQTDGISTFVARSVVVPPDEAQIAVDVSAAPSATLAQVLQALSGTGIQASDLVGQTIGNSGVFGDILVPVGGPRPTFSFALTRPAGELKSITDKLDTLRRQQPGGLVIQYSAALAASTVAIEELRRTILPQLIAEARRKAQTIASAANLMLGGIESVAETGLGSPTTAFIGVSRASSVFSDFRVTFSISVRFAAR